MALAVAAAAMVVVEIHVREVLVTFEPNERRQRGRVDVSYASDTDQLGLQE
jgi:hypothetical protein